MRQEFTKLLWGFVLLFDFRLDGIDVLPDPIGYLLIFLGMTGLMGSFEGFEKVRPIAIVLLFTSIPGVFAEQGVAVNSSTGVLLASPIFFLIGLLTTILSLILMYTILMGISNKAGVHGFIELASLAQTTWKLTLIVSIFVYLATAIPVLIIPVIILGFINFILQIMVIVKARDAFSNNSITQ